MRVLPGLKARRKRDAATGTGADPLWYKDAIIYQLHVKSFFDGNNDGIGDFAGLIDKLDYIAELGVTAIWLLPFYPSPRRDDGYDIAEYCAVHPDYGQIADVKRFVREAHARGLKVITELVINHTSNEHPWFQRARKAPPGSPERSWYVWSDDPNRYEGTRIIFLDTEKSNWTWDPEAGAYYWHRFYHHQPDLNFDNPEVLEAILRIMRFWLDLGIDGLRLDAVPYLIEREGTNNENLEETHQILKKIRAELDKNYTARMLLAEANQWPEDTQQYFGDGDECHMAFHFPLMPRMYMAIAQEDRFPITDIMRQTPDIPANCQWAIFLRNHDELTLEMVTDKERDYLWEVYAADPRARLNLGIRRRLAPLLERDRRRIELMNSLLLTMPGTPVIYYGDEIGMGDNIHLGDRDGVRTPMQWSPDRNGGFSRSDPARLVLPTIQDAQYGFQAVNVEAQWADPHSLLNWLRRMLLVRRQHQAFGRGTIRFLTPTNRHILAYFREIDNEVILCVANVSRTSQAVELDLSEHSGYAPVEMDGNTSFPSIGQLPYLLTLPPYGFYWLKLERPTEAIAWSTSSAHTIELPTLVLRDGLSALMTGPLRQRLERDLLPPYIARRRWFQNKTNVPTLLRIEGMTPFSQASDRLLYAELLLETRGVTDRYVLPFGIAWEDEPSAPFEATLAIARARYTRRVGLLTDGFATVSFAQAVLEGLRSNITISLGTAGSLSFQAEPILDLSTLPTEQMTIDWSAAEQSNSTLIVNKQFVIKLFRKVTPGVHPETEMSRALTRTGFTRAPQLLGTIVRKLPDNSEATIGTVQNYVLNQSDGWTWMLARLARIVDEQSVDPIAGAAEAPRFESDQALILALGRQIGALHAALAGIDDDSAFVPEPLGPETVASWQIRARDQVEAALDLLQSQTFDDEVTSATAQQLTNSRLLLEKILWHPLPFPDNHKLTRIHGDLHLGQTLVAGTEIYIIDFEGEPLKSLDIRREKTSALRDVAGMLRSFDYAAATVSRGRRLAAGGAASHRADQILDQFRSIANSTFLEGYKETAPFSLGGAAHYILQIFLIEKAAYEIIYESQNRPNWIIIPTEGLLRLINSFSFEISKEDTTS